MMKRLRYLTVDKCTYIVYNILLYLKGGLNAVRVTKEGINAEKRVLSPKRLFFAYKSVKLFFCDILKLSRL